jgi:hypothetical protein
MQLRLALFPACHFFNPPRKALSANEYSYILSGANCSDVNRSSFWTIPDTSMAVAMASKASMRLSNLDACCG